MSLERFVQDLVGSSRPELLEALREAPARYSDLARALKVSEGELSRNLKRLQSAGLVVKDAEGLFRPTPLAAVAAAQAEGLRFVTERAEFLRDHAMDELPHHLLRRIDVLAKADVVQGPFPLFRALEQVFTGVRTHFFSQWIIAETTFSEEQVALQQRLYEAIATHKPSVRAVVLEAERHLYAGFDQVPGLEVRLRASGPISMAKSDGGAVLHFNRTGGGLDMETGFFGTDPAFMAWCDDLFGYFWETSREGPLVAASPG